MAKFDYSKFFGDKIDLLKNEGRYRIFADVERHVGEFPKADFHQKNGTRAVTVWCSNDYLGMGQHPAVIEAMVHALREHGAGAGGTRNISGTHHLIVELERELADLHDKEAALLFTSGYVANECALNTIAGLLPDCIIFSDECNHDSMIQGIRHSKAERVIFKHNNAAHLAELLANTDIKRPKLIAFESVYSMDGDISPMKEILDLAQRHNALTYLDETHACGLYGHKGGGLAQREGLTNRFDVIQGGLGKAFGVIGGFITSSSKIIDVVRSYGHGFIFTTAMPPVVAAGAIASIKHLKISSAERERHGERVKKTQAALMKAGLPIIPTVSHIIPLMVGDSVLCKRASDMLMEQYDIYIQPINYPTVPRGAERLRITPSPLHTDQMIDELVTALSEIWQQLEIKLAA